VGRCQRGAIFALRAMVIGVGYVTIHIHDSQSLKDKRRVVRSLVERMRQRFNASVAEVDRLDSWQVAGIGFACVSNSGAHVDQMLAEIVRFVESNVALGSLGEVSTELIHID
jgi:uncharacterized protein YlxP (DUF503 family)